MSTRMQAHADCLEPSAQPPARLAPGVIKEALWGPGPLTCGFPLLLWLICRADQVGSRPNSGLSTSLLAQDLWGVRAGPVCSSDELEAPPDAKSTSECVFIIGFRSWSSGCIYIEAGVPVANASGHLSWSSLLATHSSSECFLTAGCLPCQFRIHGSCHKGIDNPLQG